MIPRFLAVLLLASTVLAQPRGLPEPVVPDGLGVNIHFVRPDPAEVDKLAHLGVRFIRMDFGWGGTERKRGEYDFSGYDQLVQAMSQKNIRCLFILDYGNRLYDNNLGPHSDEAQAAFAKWAGAAAKHYAGKGILWEIWNEPNLKQFWKPVPNVEDYSKLALATIDAIRAADKDAFIMAPASSGFPWEFFDGMAKHGVFAKLDAVSVHPYRQSNPETAEADYHKLRLLLDRAVPGERIPIVSGEWGYSTAWKNYTEERQAQYLPRQWLMNLANDVHLSIWYDWRDDGLDPKEPEHHFGTVFRDFSDKQTSIAARKLCTELAGLRFIRRIPTDKPEDWVLLFAGADVGYLAHWTTGTPHELMIAHSGATPGPSVSEGPVPPGDNRALAEARTRREPLQLGNSPVYTRLLKNPALGAWSPQHQTIVVRIGKSNVIPISLRDPGALKGGSFRVSIGGKSSKPVAVPDGAKSIDLPIELESAELATQHARVEFLASGDKPGPLHTAQVTLLLANHISAKILPPVGDTAYLLIQNPSGEGQRLSLSAGSFEPVNPAVLGEAQGFGAPGYLLPAGQVEHLVKMQSSKPVRGAIHAEGKTPAGVLLFKLPDVLWKPISLDADWKAQLDGENKGEASANLEIVELKDPPVPVKQGMKVAYRFPEGKRYLMGKPPQAARVLDGKPTVLGLWVRGNGSGDYLRMRFLDSTGQAFQSDGPQMNFTGWKWIEFPLDASHGPHWGGANDGVIHYPIRLDSLPLIDNARLKAGKDQEVLIALPAVRD